MFNDMQCAPYQLINLDHTQVMVKRIDLVHPCIIGNKFFKLKYNLIEARQQGYKQLLSFGGAYSNHIYALAHAAQQYNFGSIGIIRGNELADKALNPLLKQANQLGMQLQFIDRSTYRQKSQSDYLAILQARYPDAYILPEGGTNLLAVQGCQEILNSHDRQEYDVICCAVGTGGTFAGLINASGVQQKLLGFSALKGDFLTQNIMQWTTRHNWQIFSDAYFGGYGRYTAELLAFIQEMQFQQLPLEPCYTAKALFGLRRCIKAGALAKDARILFIHTGGIHPSIDF